MLPINATISDYFHLRHLLLPLLPFSTSLLPFPSSPKFLLPPNIYRPFSNRRNLSTIVDLHHIPSITTVFRVYPGLSILSWWSADGLKGLPSCSSCCLLGCTNEKGHCWKLFGFSLLFFLFFFFFGSEGHVWIIQIVYIECGHENEQMYGWKNIDQSREIKMEKVL